MVIPANNNQPIKPIPFVSAIEVGAGKRTDAVQPKSTASLTHSVSLGKAVNPLEDPWFMLQMPKEFSKKHFHIERSSFERQSTIAFKDGLKKLGSGEIKNYRSLINFYGIERKKIEQFQRTNARDSIYYVQEDLRKILKNFDGLWSKIHSQRFGDKREPKEKLLGKFKDFDSRNRIFFTKNTGLAGYLDKIYEARDTIANSEALKSGDKEAFREEVEAFVEKYASFPYHVKVVHEENLEVLRDKFLRYGHGLRRNAQRMEVDEQTRTCRFPHLRERIKNHIERDPIEGPMGSIYRQKFHDDTLLLETYYHPDIEAVDKNTGTRLNSWQFTQSKHIHKIEEDVEKFFEEAMNSENPQRVIENVAKIHYLGACLGAFAHGNAWCINMVCATILAHKGVSFGRWRGGVSPDAEAFLAEDMDEFVKNYPRLFEN